MQNFMEIGPVVFAAEYVGMKNGCTSYNTSKPVYHIIIIIIIIIIVIIIITMS